MLTFESATVPNAFAALLLHIRDITGRQPHIYLEWTEGNPAANVLRFLFFGVGEVAPVIREVLRRAEPLAKTPRPCGMTQPGTRRGNSTAARARQLLWGQDR